MLLTLQAGYAGRDSPSSQPIPPHPLLLMKLPQLQIQVGEVLHWKIRQGLPAQTHVCTYIQVYTGVTHKQHSKRSLFYMEHSLHSQSMDTHSTLLLFRANRYYAIMNAILFKSSRCSEMWYVLKTVRAYSQPSLIAFSRLTSFIDMVEGR